MLKDVLKEARHRRGLKQEDVAKLVKVAKQTYLKWENGTTEPKASQVKDLALV
ncbi:helix-turn-helix transcriptional regulator, partial [Shewanella sp.]